MRLWQQSARGSHGAVSRSLRQNWRSLPSNAGSILLPGGGKEPGIPTLFLFIYLG